MASTKQDWTQAELACKTPVELQRLRHGAKFDSSECSTVVVCRDCSWRAVRVGDKHRALAFMALNSHRLDEHFGSRS